MFGSLAPSNPNFIRVGPFRSRNLESRARVGASRDSGFESQVKISDLLAFNYLKEAKPARSNIPRSIGMKWRRSLRHQDPVFTAYMCGQSCPSHCRHTQGRVGLSAIDVESQFARFSVPIHPTTIRAPKTTATGFDL